jgi:hypothetical protein
MAMTGAMVVSMPLCLIGAAFRIERRFDMHDLRAKAPRQHLDETPIVWRLRRRIAFSKNWFLYERIMTV